MIRTSLALATLAACAPQGSLGDDKVAIFASRVQAKLDAYVSHYQKRHPGLVMQVGYVSADVDLGFVSGQVLNPNDNSTRNASTSDTLLFGSGTKPFTATAVMRLVDAGKLKLTDKLSSYVDPYLQNQNGTTLAELYGNDVNSATVLDLLRMGTGIPDFEEDYAFDKDVLSNGDRFMDFPYAAMRWAAEVSNGTLHFKPGEYTSYSSTGYDIAGLLVAAVLQPEDPWYALDFATAIYGGSSRFPTMSFPPASTSDASEKISKFLTVPGHVMKSSWGKSVIYEQSPSVLGWTCGNMVSSAQDVARFFYDLLGEERLISAELVQEMTRFELLTWGWSTGKLPYGAGLMELYSGKNHNSSWSRYYGHGGDTYGFLSKSGWIPGANVSFSVVQNQDGGEYAKCMACWVQDIASDVFDEPANLTCSCGPKTLLEEAEVLV